jgi:hypothetical protein
MNTINTIKIYHLLDPLTNKIRYVGKTKDLLDKRLQSHIKDAKSIKNRNNLHKKYWILKLLKTGDCPIIELIDKVPEKEWVFWEQHYISLYKSWGFDLLNVTIGGEGQHGIKRFEESRKKQSLSTKGRVSNRKGINMSQEQKDKLSISLKEANKSGRRKQIIYTKELRDKMSKSRKEAFKNGKLNVKGNKNGMFGKTKRVVINDVLYKSEHEAAKVLNVHYKTIHSRIKSANFPTYSNFISCP